MRIDCFGRSGSLCVAGAALGAASGSSGVAGTALGAPSKRSAEVRRQLITLGAASFCVAGAALGALLARFFVAGAALGAPQVRCAWQVTALPATQSEPERPKQSIRTSADLYEGAPSAAPATLNEPEMLQVLRLPRKTRRRPKS